MSLLAFTLAAALSMVDQAPPAAETGSPAAKAAKERLVCRKDTRANSRVPIKVCKTKAEWDSQMEAARQGVAEIQQRQQVLVCPPAGC